MKRLALAIVIATTPACSLFAPSTQALTIHTNSSEADIYLDGAVVGKGSTVVNVARTSHHIRAVLGDLDAHTSVGTRISALGILDILGGILFLVPFIGVAGPGFTQLDRTTVELTIPNLPAPPPAVVTAPE